MRQGLLTIAPVAAGGLLLELVQTRILSALYFNHVVYLTVTVALLGFGIAGCLLSISGDRRVDFSRLTALALASFAATAVLCPALASRTPLLPGPQGVALGACYLLLSIPFLCAGTAVGLLLMRHAAHVQRLYGADLAASAAGAWGFAYLLRPLGAEGVIWLVSALAVGALLVHSWSQRGLRAAAVGAALALVVAGAGLHGRLIGKVPQPDKVTAAAFVPGSRVRVEAEEWTPLAKIDVLFDPSADIITGARAPGNSDRILTQDGSAHTILLGPDRVRALVEEGGTRRVHGDALGYVLQPAPRDVLVIGVGGGKDVVLARAHGARHIVGVEVNPATVDLLRGRYRPLALWPDWPGVELVWAEGRQYARRTQERFDVIVLSGVDTFAALSSGAYVLTENYLYTVEGIGDLLGLLRPHGVLVIYRWLFSQPRESLRLATLYLEAAERRGFSRPQRGIAVVAEDLGWKQWGATLMKREPFRADELARLAAVVERQAPAQRLVYLPPVLPATEQRALEQRAYSGSPRLLPARAAYAGLLAAPTAEARRHFEDRYPFDVSPVSDARPFFFEYERVRAHWLLRGDLDQLRGSAVYESLLLLLLLTLGVGGVGTLLPLSVFASEGLRVPGAAGLAAFFAALGLGFMLLEIGLMQRLSLFLGDPVRSLTVVLAGLLLFTGIGSMLAARFGSARRAIRASTLIVAGLAALGPPLLPPLLDACFALPLLARIALVLGLLLPLGLALGIPFATGLRRLEPRAPRFIPWAWGINGLSSVAGSVIAIALAMQLGFDAALLLGALCYVGAAMASRVVAA